MALGLQAIHDAGYVYRDLKPQNVLLDGEGQVRISDMGLTADISKGPIKQCSGTRGYWSPETIKKEAVRASTPLHPARAAGCQLWHLRLHAPRRPAVPFSLSLAGRRPSAPRVVTCARGSRLAVHHGAGLVVAGRHDVCPLLRQDALQG